MMSRDRRRRALAALRRTDLEGLSSTERVVLAVSFLVCDESGSVTEAEIRDGVRNAATVKAARQLLAEMGA